MLENGRQEDALKADAKATAHDQRTALVRGLMAQESAAQDAKTIRLRALRLEKEAQDKATLTSHPAPPKPKRRRTT